MGHQLIIKQIQPMRIKREKTLNNAPTILSRALIKEQKIYTFRSKDI